MHKAPYNEAFFAETQPREIHGLRNAHTAYDDKGESDKQQNINDIIGAAPSGDSTEQPACGFLDELPAQRLMQDVKEAYDQACDFMKRDPKERPLVHEKKKGDQQKNIKDKLESDSLHRYTPFDHLAMNNEQ